MVRGVQAEGKEFSPPTLGVQVMMLVNRKKPIQASGTNKGEQ